MESSRARQRVVCWPRESKGQSIRKGSQGGNNLFFSSELMHLVLRMFLQRSYCQPPSHGNAVTMLFPALTQHCLFAFFMFHVCCGCGCFPQCVGLVLGWALPGVCRHCYMRPVARCCPCLIACSSFTTSGSCWSVSKWKSAVHISIAGMILLITTNNERFQQLKGFYCERVGLLKV